MPLHFWVQVEEALDQIDLKKKKATLVKDLNGGQQQKLVVGIAIIGNPKVSHHVCCLLQLSEAVL